MKTLWTYIRPHRIAIIIGLIIKFGASVVELFIPSLLAKIVDEAKGVGDVALWGSAMVLCAVLALIGNIVANRYSAITAGKITRRLRHDLFSKILSLSASQVDDYTISSLISRLTSDTYQVNNFIMRIQRIGVRAPILLIGGICITMIQSPKMTLVLVALLPFIALFTYLITKKGVPLYRRQQEKLDSVVRVVQENATGVRVVKALSRTDYERERFRYESRTLSDTEQRASVVMGLSGPINSLILNLGLCAILITGGFLLNVGDVKIGTVLAFLNYFTMILMAMTAITRIFVLTSRGMASAARVSEVLKTSEVLTVQSIPRTETTDHITFDNVTFSYNKRKPNIKGLSFSLAHGQTLGIIGATGSGKTTLISLLMRFYDTDEGAIRIDGEDVRSIDPDRLHTMFGVALQNDFLRMGSIRENVAFDRDISEEELHAAAVTACAEDFILEKEGEYAYELTLRGSNLSGGQKQRLLIARAVAGSPQILILDDSSGALDYKTDSRLRHNLAERCRGVTTILVAQRVSSIRHADKILVMDAGSVIAEGTHDELLATCDVYREIAQTQMGGDFDA